MTGEKDPDFQQAPPSGYFKKRTVSDADTPDLAGFEIKPEQPASQSWLDPNSFNQSPPSQNWLDPNSLNQGSPSLNQVDQTAASQNTASQNASSQNAVDPSALNLNSAAQDPASEEFLKNYMAKLTQEQTILARKNKGVIYLPVGSMKFTLLCLCVPFHGYEIWWLWKQFVCQKERGGKIASPMWRLNLPFLYLRNLLEAMRDEGKLYGLDKELKIEKIILYWVMLALCLVFPPPASFLGMFSFAPFIFVNEYLIKLNKAANPDLPLDVKFTPANFLVIIVGGAYFALNLYLNICFHM